MEPFSGSQAFFGNSFEETTKNLYWWWSFPSPFSWRNTQSQSPSDCSVETAKEMKVLQEHCKP